MSSGELGIASVSPVTALANSKISNHELKIINPSKVIKWLANQEQAHGQGHSIKLLKACISCRKRKQKCELTEKLNICKMCLVNNRECIFEHKYMELPKFKKRKLDVEDNAVAIIKDVKPVPYDDPSVSKNQENVSFPEQSKTSNLGASFAEHTKNPNSSGNLIGKNYNIQTSGDLNNNIFNGNVFSSDRSIDGSSKSNYFNTIANSTPFIKESIFNYPLDDFCCCCIEIATNIDTSDKDPQFHQKNEALLSDLYNYLKNQIHWNECNLSCFLLLPLRIALDSSMIDSALHALKDMINADTKDSLSLNLIMAGYIVDAWTSCFHRKAIILPPNHISKCMKFLSSLNDKCFSYQICIIGLHLYKIKWLMFTELQPLQILQLEYDILLWPVKLSTEFSILKDRLFGSPESFTLHIIHNVLLLNFYTFAIANLAIGSAISLFAVPGVYHFLSELAKSTYRVNVSQYENWCLISESRVMSSTMLLKLNEIMDFEPFKKTLCLFKKGSNVSDKNYQDCIYNDVQNVIATREISIDTEDDEDETDGGRVYWVFRDIRSMSLHMYLDKQ